MALTPEEKELLRGWKPGWQTPEVKTALAKVATQEEAEEIFGEHAFVSLHNLRLGGKWLLRNDGQLYEDDRKELLQAASDPAYGSSREVAAGIVREWEGLVYPPYLLRLRFARWLTVMWMNRYISQGRTPLPKGFPTWGEVLPRLMREHPLLYRMLTTMRLGLDEEESPSSRGDWMRHVKRTRVNRGPRGAWTQEFMRFLYTCGTLWEAQIMARKAEAWMARTGAETFKYADFPAEPWDLQAVGTLALRLLWGGADDWASVQRVEADHGFWERICHRTALRFDQLAHVSNGYFDVSFPLAVFFAYDLERQKREDPFIPFLQGPWNIISNAVFEPLVLMHARRREDPAEGWAEATSADGLLANRTLGRLFRIDLLSLPPLEVVWDDGAWPLPQDPRYQPEWQEQYWIDSLASLPVKVR